MRLFLILVVFIFNQLHAQGGYISIGGTSLVNKGFNPGFTFGGGYLKKSIGVGVLCEFYGIGKGKEDFGVAAFDLRTYLQRSRVSPYISIQPGVVLYEKTIFNTYWKGSFAGSAVLGIDALFKEDKPGLNLFVGYQYISFKVDKSFYSRNSYFKSGITIQFH